MSCLKAEWELLAPQLTVGEAPDSTLSRTEAWEAGHERHNKAFGIIVNGTSVGWEMWGSWAQQKAEQVTNMS